MTASPLPVLRAEWLKRRRSLAGWLILAGGLFTPVIIFAVRLHQRRGLPAMYAAPEFWEKHWTQSWESITIMILPLMGILITALVTQIEFRNNTWKQVHAAPQPPAAVFFAKLAVILAMLLQLFVVLNAGVYLSAVLPALLFDHVRAPAAPFPLGLALARSLRFFVDCLPVVALQYGLALHFRNFMVPVGVGAGVWILTVGMFNTRVSWLIPFSYPGLDFMMDSGYRTAAVLPAGIQTLALGTFAFFILAGYAMYAGKKDRGS